VIRLQRPTVIMSTYPIATAQLIALTLHRLTGLPWVADCRDSMSEPGYPIDGLTWRTNRWLERAMVKYAARVVFTTEGTREMYAKRYPSVPAYRWTVIENGFDEENIQAAEIGLEPRKRRNNGQITLLHSGILYPKERDPRPFFSALNALKCKTQISHKKLRIVLRACGSEILYRELLRDYNIEDMVSIVPTISYCDALQEMLRADGLLLFQSEMCNHQIPAKIYEYMRVGRPIFAMVDPRGNTAELLEKSGGALIVDISDSHEIEAGLCQFIVGLENSSLMGVHETVSKKYSRRARTQELAALLNEVVA